MASGSFLARIPFVRTSDEAVRHLQILTQALRKIALAGLIGGGGCGFLASLLGRILGAYNGPASNDPGLHEMSGIPGVAEFLALALIAFSICYLIVGWGLSRRKMWARYAGGLVFGLKILLCIWLGHASLAEMTIFLFIAGLDLYGLWVLLSNATAQLFTSPQLSQATQKPANLVT